ncbi:MAG: 50S ribosomal protein L18 [Myxococcales bacterium]|nr:50S ribosomal protein L18 [Myxococcales bacterium]
MTAANQKLDGRTKRKLRIRKTVVGTAERPRMSVFRSARHIYAQVIDDLGGVTMAAASTMSPDLRGNLDGNKTASAKKVGALVAEMCKAKSIVKVVFDRNGYRYHGRIKALADAAREGGLEF